MQQLSQEEGLLSQQTIREVEEKPEEKITSSEMTMETEGALLPKASETSLQQDIQATGS